MANDDKRSYDARQYQLMNNQIRLYMDGTQSLGALISRLKALLAALEAPDPAWKSEFQSEWWELEQVHANAVVRKERDPIIDANVVLGDQHNQAIIQAALKRMERLLDKRVSTE